MQLVQSTRVLLQKKKKHSTSYNDDRLTIYSVNR